MEWIHLSALFAGGLLAAASFIVSKKPDAEQVIGKLRPYQGFLGVGLLTLGVWNIIDGSLGVGIDIMKFKVLLGLTIISLVVCQVLLGFLLGMPQIAKWIPGESDAETKAVELGKKLGVYNVTIGFVAIITGLLWLLYRFQVL